jgi:hypothetical protein
MMPDEDQNCSLNRVTWCRKRNADACRIPISTYECEHRHPVLFCQFFSTFLPGEVTPHVEHRRQIGSG